VVLKQVSAIAKKATPNHCYCCRFGGEEFSIILPGKTYEEAMLVAEAVKNNVPRLQFEENPDVRVTISQGLIMSNFQSPEAQALEKFDAFIKLADDNLYRSKLDGRDRITGSKLD
jgi:diguanylate cyclase (GGDEF)-like protein